MRTKSSGIQNNRDKKNIEERRKLPSQGCPNALGRLQSAYKGKKLTPNEEQKAIQVNWMDKRPK